MCWFKVVEECHSSAAGELLGAVHLELGVGVGCGVVAGHAHKCMKLLFLRQSMDMQDHDMDRRHDMWLSS